MNFFRSVNMKSLCLLTLLLINVFYSHAMSIEDPKDLSIILKCFEEYETEFDPRHLSVVPEDTYLCIHACVLKRKGYLLEDGNFVFPGGDVNSLMPDLQKSMGDCKNQAGQDDCKYLKCLKYRSWMLGYS